MHFYFRCLWIQTPSVPAYGDECNRENTHLFCKGTIPTGYFPDIENFNITQVKLEKLDFNLIHSTFPNLRNLNILGNNMTKLRRIEMPRITLNIKVMIVFFINIICSDFYKNKNCYEIQSMTQA